MVSVCAPPEGAPAPSALVYDANPHGALRLTVVHHTFWGTGSPALLPGAALWVRVGSELDTEEAFQRWRLGFAEAAAAVEVDETRVQVRVTGVVGPVALGTEHRTVLGRGVLDPA